METRTGIGPFRQGTTARMPVEIDGARGEGGGQLLRAALSLSALLGLPVRVRGIRARRRMPGLQAQHLAAVRGLAEICGATVTGATLGSGEVTFLPGAVRPGEYRVEVGTAGSVGLVAQALLLPLALADGASRVRLRGGTHVPWSPPVQYLQAVLLPALGRMGVEAEIGLVRWGFYPRGGGEILLEVAGGARLRPISLVRPTVPPIIRGLSAVSRLPREIAERQRLQVRERLEREGYAASLEIAEVEAADPGSFLILVAETGTVPAGFSALGERGKPAERVADEAVDPLLAFLRAGAGCDPHLADQLGVAMALAPGTSRITPGMITEHLASLLEVAQGLLGCPVQVRGRPGEAGSVTVEGVGVRTATDRPSSTTDGEPGGGGAIRGLAGGAVIRKAQAADAPAIQGLLAHFAARGELLPRTLNEVYEHLRDFFVCEVEGRVVGLCGLALYWEDLAEVRSLAVHEDYGGRGLGGALVQACVAEAASLGIRRVFALTYRATFFERLGFGEIDKRDLPQKIWKDCYKCAKFANCDETALIREAAGQAP